MHFLVRNCFRGQILKFHVIKNSSSLIFVHKDRSLILINTINAVVIGTLFPVDAHKQHAVWILWNVIDSFCHNMMSVWICKWRTNILKSNLCMYVYLFDKRDPIISINRLYTILLKDQKYTLYILILLATLRKIVWASNFCLHLNELINV